MRLARRVEELRAELSKYTPGQELSWEAQLQELRDIFGAHNAVLYNPEPLGGHWDLEFSIWVGHHAEQRREAHRGHVRRSSLHAPSFAAYDPYQVQPNQRNRALTVEGLFALEPSASQSHRRVWSAIDAGQEDQLRALVCRGPRLLGWLGLVREERFRPAEVRAFASLIEPVRARLWAERAARAPRDRQGLLEAVLESMPDAALIFDSHGRVELGNAAGLRLLDGNPAEQKLLSSLREFVLRGEQHPEFSVTPLRIHGCPSYTLALRIAAADRRFALVERACRAFRISGPCAAVLELVAEGRSNKEIAARLKCAEVTVERHLTQLFRASGTSSRAELLARLLSFALRREYDE
jgi:DNA-binding CsgD family transcriptional regulator